MPSGSPVDISVAHQETCRQSPKITALIKQVSARTFPAKPITTLFLSLKFPDFQDVCGFLIGDHSDMLIQKAELFLVLFSHMTPAPIHGAEPGPRKVALERCDALVLAEPPIQVLLPEAWAQLAAASSVCEAASSALTGSGRKHNTDPLETLEPALQ
ncbi:hypothetical protein MC885_021876 [Smutsia gigantea]|nr:hypothetical protein MC885_021876 [Smutsia gigantea]